MVKFIRKEDISPSFFIASHKAYYVNFRKITKLDVGNKSIIANQIIDLMHYK